MTPTTLPKTPVPHTGDAFAQIVLGNSHFTINPFQWIDTSSDQRSYFQTKLYEPLIAGMTYHVSLYVTAYKDSSNLSSSNAGTINNLGLYLSNTPVSNFNSQGRLNVQPQLEFVNWNVIADTFVYMKLASTYIASGGEEYLTIGNFDYYDHQNFIFLKPTAGSTFITHFYIFVDDIAIVRDTVQPLISLTTLNLGPDTTICPGQALTIGGEAYFFSYQWSNGDTTRFTTIFQPGIYWCTVDFGCSTFTDTIEIALSTAPAKILADDTVLCSSDFPFTLKPTVTLSNHTWSDNSTSDSFTIHGQGLYWIEAITSCGDTVRDSIVITTLPTSLDLGNDTTICMPGPFAITLQAAPGFSDYFWSTGANSSTVIMTEPGTYWLEATNACGATSDTIVIQSIHDFLPTLPDDTLICNAQQSLTLSAPGELTQLLWNTGSTAHEVTIEKPGIYWVEGLSPCGIIRDTITIAFCPPEILELSHTDTVICAGDCISFEAAIDNYTSAYYWQFAGGTPVVFTGPQPPQICYELPGIYTAMLTVGNAGGFDSITATIQVLPVPVKRFADTSLTAVYNEEITLNACADGEVVRWFEDDSLVCIDCPSFGYIPKLQTTRLMCVVENEDCVDTCYYQIYATGIPTDVWLPNAFTPNGDSHNDIFGIITDNPNIEVVELSVYNRWGQRVFSSQGRNGWDGNQSGKPADVGTYFYFLRYKLSGTEANFQKKGDVVLIR